MVKSQNHARLAKAVISLVVSVRIGKYTVPEIGAGICEAVMRHIWPRWTGFTK